MMIDGCKNGLWNLTSHQCLYINDKTVVSWCMIWGGVDGEE
jgi:hypothetical protein